MEDINNSTIELEDINNSTIEYADINKCDVELEEINKCNNDLEEINKCNVELEEINKIEVKYNKETKPFVEDKYRTKILLKNELKDIYTKNRINVLLKKYKDLPKNIEQQKKKIKGTEKDKFVYFKKQKKYTLKNGIRYKHNINLFIETPNIEIPQINPYKIII